MTSAPSVRPRPVSSSSGAVLRQAAVAVLLFALAAAALAFQGYARDSDRVVDEGRLLARTAAADLDRYVRTQLGTLETAAASQGVVEQNTRRMRPFFDRISASEVGFTGGIFWVDRAGTLQVRSGYDGPPLDFSDRDYVQAVLATGQPYAGSARLGQITPAPIVPLAVPTFNQAAAISGVLAGSIRLDTLPLGGDVLPEAGAATLVIVDRGGTILVGREPVVTLVGADPRFLQEVSAATTRGDTHRGLGPTGIDDRLVGYALAPSAEWLVLVDRPAADAFRPGQLLLAVQLLALALSTAFVIAVLVWAARRLDGAHRAREAAYAAQRVAYDSERALRRRLEDAVAELRARESLRDAFTGVLSHELRTPVTTIYGAAKLLTRSPNGDGRESLIEDIEEESDRLLRITEDLLVLSRAERGAIAIDIEPVLVQRVVPSLIAEGRRRFPSAGIETHLPNNLPPVSSEAGPFRQVLNNLLVNAVKYSQGARIRVAAEHVGERVLVTVEDEGPGFPPSEAERLFGLFYRVEGAAQATAGTGIGLYVVRQLVTAMGGTVRAEPVEPHGARFVVDLAVYGSDDHGPRSRGGCIAASPDRTAT
jgi:signal transduction histidine kinase